LQYGHDPLGSSSRRETVPLVRPVPLDGNWRSESGRPDHELRHAEGSYDTDVPIDSIEAGLLDEVQIDLVPVLLGEGIRLFEQTCTERIELERMRLIEALGVTHLRFRVVR
jgi:hypothetical protein